MDHLKSSPSDSQISDANVLKSETEKAPISVEQTQAHARNTEFVVGPELLAEILSKKRMDMLKSPDVKDFLIQQQSKLSGKPHCSDQGEGMKSRNELSDNVNMNPQNGDRSSPSNHQR